jgi:DNA sulfur modification protein DndC
MDELVEIRRIWRIEKHEFDDTLPRIYEESTGEIFPVTKDDAARLTPDDWLVLKEIVGSDAAFFELQTALLDTECRYRGMSRRVGIHDALEGCLDRSLYPDAETATKVLQNRQTELTRAQLDLLNHQGVDGLY